MVAELNPRRETPLPPPGDFEALRGYLERHVPRGGRPRRGGTIPPLRIPMPPPLAPGELSEEARKATWTALMKVGHWLDTWPQDCYQPRYFAALLQGLAYDVLYAKDRHFPWRRYSRQELKGGRGGPAGDERPGGGPGPLDMSKQPPLT